MFLNRVNSTVDGSVSTVHCLGIWYESFWQQGLKSNAGAKKSLECMNEKTMNNSQSDRFEIDTYQIVCLEIYIW